MAAEKRNPVDLIGERFRKWGLKIDDLDAKAIKNRLENLRISQQELIGLMDTAESVAAAELAKLAWNPTADRAKHMRLAKNAIAAGRLANEIGAMFPPPWEGERAPIGNLVTGLVAFIDGSLESALPIDADFSVRVASKMLRAIKGRLSRRGGRVRWELVRDLVRLASRGKIDVSERTVRRYIEEPHDSTFAVHEYWRQNLKLLNAAARLAPERTGKPFEAAAKNFLNPNLPASSAASDTSGKKAARKNP